MSKQAVHRPRVRATELAGYRKVYLDFDQDAKRFGIEVAIFNAGFLVGDTQRRDRMTKAILAALKLK